MVIVVIISTILEMILPEGNNKKYIKTIVGIFILFNIIGPVITRITGEGISFESIAQNINMENISSKEVMKLDTDSSVKEVYLDNLKQDLKNKVSEKGYEAKEININVQMSEKENYGKINSIYFKLEKKLANSVQENEIPIVNEININISNNEEKKQESISSEEYKEMQKYIANTYELNLENVNIY